MRTMTPMLLSLLGGLGACFLADSNKRVVLDRVVSAADPECGLPADGRTLLITALGDFPASPATARSRDLSVGEALNIDSFPADTRVLAVEVIGSGGVVRAIGKSARFDLDALTDGDRIPVFMAPPLGACAIGPAQTVRTQPLLARAGLGVLVAGGVGVAGVPVHLVELYNPQTGAFEVVADRLYGTDEHGLAGASVTSLAGERVVIAGGPVSAYQIYDVDSRAFSAALFLNPERAFHAAVALDEDRVLLAGGCAALTEAGICDPAQPALSTSIIDVGAGVVHDGPPLQIARIGGIAVRETAGTVLLVGGADVQGQPVNTAERLVFGNPGAPGMSQLIADVGGAAAPLQAGGTLAGLAPPGGQPSTAVAVVPPGAMVASPGANAPAPRAGATLTPLQDGRVLALGGLPADPEASGELEALLYEPVRHAFTPVTIAGMPAGRLSTVAAGAGVPRPEHGTALLDDGTVLVVGGRGSNGNPSAEAWIVRPELVGPFASDAIVSFGDLALALRMAPRDPSRASLRASDGDADAAAPHYRMESSANNGLPSEWAVVAGPIFGRARMTARVRTSDSGLAVLFGFRSADDYRTVVFIPGQPATGLRVFGDSVAAIASCQGQTITADQLQTGDESRLVEVEIGVDTISAAIANTEVLSCTGIDPVPEGQVGLGVVGDRGSVLRIDSLAVRRLGN